MSLVPIPSEDAGATCANCAAPLVPDQRYCLACGHPCSPVRLAFLDVLQDEHGRSEVSRSGGASAIELASSGYAPVFEPVGSAAGWLRRYAGLFGLLSVLLTSVLVGLLVGHWITQSKGPSQQVLKVEGLGGAPASVAASPTAANAAVTTTSAAATSPAAKSPVAASREAKEVKEANEPKAQPPAPVKVNTQTLSKLTGTNGKKHQQEINKLTEGGKPIETGGGSSSSKSSSPKPTSESGKAGGGSSVTTIE